MIQVSQKEIDKLFEELVSPSNRDKGSSDFQKAFESYTSDLSQDPRVKLDYSPNLAINNPGEFLDTLHKDYLALKEASEAFKKLEKHHKVFTKLEKTQPALFI